MKISSGSKVLDTLLKGGYLTKHLNTIYGPAASGKTTCCLLAVIACYKAGKKSIFLDTENGFNVERLKQLTPEYKEVLDSVILLKANSFLEQKRNLEFLSDMFPNTKIGLIVVDTIGSHYRVERINDVKAINQELAEQVDQLREIYKNNDVVVLITNQVYANLKDEVQDSVGIVGGEIIRNRSKCLIQLKVLHKNKRRAILEKFPEIKNKKTIDFEIKEKGFIPL